jgi:Tfp pilus assembly protein PilN
MMKAALMTAELIEPTPRTVILAEITNTLPSGVSLRTVKLQEKELTAATAAKPNSYEQAKAAADNASGAAVALKPTIETTIELEGLAPSDIQVAGYIAQLNNSVLLDNVELVLSKEYIKDEVAFREFKLTATLKKDVHLSKQNIELIRTKRQNMM